MKKVFAILAITGFVACNNAETKPAPVDSPKATVDSPKAVVDSPKVDSPKAVVDSPATKK
jgi:hypothetical protein